MSTLLITRSPDLKRLRDDGYHVEVKSGYLLIRDVPYLDEDKNVQRGVLVSALELAGDITTKPTDHVVMFTGTMPHDPSGRPLEQIRNSDQREYLDIGLTINHRFSAKPSGGYRDYHHKMKTYANILTEPAQAVEETVSARTYPIVETDDETSMFAYMDTATSRAGIGAIAEKLALSSVAIVGLGGTGSYILDLVSKTRVKTIHLFDGDCFRQHNAFRSPGATPRPVLEKEPIKGQHWRDVYAGIHPSIIAHDYVDDTNAEVLAEMDYVFLSLDKGNAKRLAVEKLIASDVPFIDVGMGIDNQGGCLRGQVRVTAITDWTQHHEVSNIPFTDGGVGNEYSRNIQTAELNALNAALAVIKWKKTLGFYADDANANSSSYLIASNRLVNDQN